MSDTVSQADIDKAVAELMVLAFLAAKRIAGNAVD
jgi:hypothetical protein